MVSFQVNSQGWQWAKQIGGIGRDGGSALIDSSGNIFCSGTFEGNCYFDNDTLGSLAQRAGYIAKYNANGNELWAKKITGNNSNDQIEFFGISVIDMPNRCFYCGGNFQGQLTIDTFSIYSTGGLDAFISKFDFDGNCLWVRRASSPADDEPKATAMDDTGNIYWTGLLGSAGTFENVNLPAGVFLTKLDPSGNIIYARHEMTGGYPRSLNIINNSIIITASTTDKLVVFDTTTFLSNRYNGIILAKTELNGNIIRGVRFESSGFTVVFICKPDAFNSLYLAGEFEDTLNIYGTTLISNNGRHNLYFCKFDSNFNLKWVNQGHTDGYYGSALTDIIFDQGGNLYVSGFFSGDETFGGINVTATTVSDMVLAKYDTAGNCLGLKHFGIAQGGALCLNPDGSLILSGHFWYGLNIGNTSFTSRGDFDAFFTKSDPISGIEKKAQSGNKLIIYANPNTGKCNITIPDEFKHEKNLTLKIFDNNGKMIQNDTVFLDQDKVSVNISAEAKGIYTAVLTNGKKSYTGKIVVK
jgi:hypothetical protein